MVVDPLPDPAQDGPAATRLTAFVRGQVQGVGMRWWVRSRALELGLSGHAGNLTDGRVEVVAEGGRTQCLRLLHLLGEQPSKAGRPGAVTGVSEQWSSARGIPHRFVER